MQHFHFQKYPPPSPYNDIFFLKQLPHHEMRSESAACLSDVPLHPHPHCDKRCIRPDRSRCSAPTTDPQTPCRSSRPLLLPAPEEPSGGSDPREFPRVLSKLWIAPRAVVHQQNSHADV